MTSAAGDNRTGHLPFLFEIGTDDLPARFIPVAIDHLREAFPALIDELGLGRTEPRILATPRRTALLVDSLAVRQEDREIEVKGPPLSIAYGDDGEPTPAALGFARKNGVDLADCGTVADAKGGDSHDRNEARYKTHGLRCWRMARSICSSKAVMVASVRS